jgi:hypothetical protein|nr:hypothetical protein [uncultured Acetatifactor sp.]
MKKRFFTSYFFSAAHQIKLIPGSVLNAGTYVRFDNALPLKE